MNSQQVPRIVSKSRYLRYLGKKATLGGSGVLTFTSGVLGMIVCFGLLLAALGGIRDSIKYGDIATLTPMLLLCLAVIVFGGASSLFFIRSGVAQINEADKLEPVVPLTRKTAEQLPAEQSLVRASSEPSEGQQAVLLRAAGSDTQTPPEELLRAATHEVKP